MNYQTLVLDIADHLAIITLNRPDKLNALNERMRAELPHALRAAETAARAIVFTGAGRAFCSGADLSDSGQSVDAAESERVMREELGPLIQSIMHCPLPTIAAVNGVAAGGGANLALAADVVIAAESASFAQVFSRIGLVPDLGGTWMLPRLVGRARAMGAALFAEQISAAQARDWGMIWEAVPDAEFAAHWQARAAHLAQGPTSAYRRIKQAFQASDANDIETQLALEARLQGESTASDDFREGVRAFLEKRKPVYTGQ